MDLHRCPRLRSAWSSFHRAAPRALLGREGHAICPRLFPCGRVFPAPSRLCRLPMLCHLVTRQRSHRHILSVLYALDPSLMLLAVGGSLPCYLLPVRRLRLGLRRMAWATDHSECLPNISPQAHLIKQSDQGTNILLLLLWISIWILPQSIKLQSFIGPLCHLI